MACFSARTPRRCPDQPEKGQAGRAHQRIVLGDHQVFQRGQARKQANVLESARDLRELADTKIIQRLKREVGAVGVG